MTFQDKVILIVGASSGMGRAVALRLAAAGARLAVTARGQDRLDRLVAEITREGGVCVAFAADAGDPAAAAGVVARTIAHFGHIDLALLNVGGAPALDLRVIGAAEAHAYMRSNYDVAVNYLFPLLRHMAARRCGTIAHTNSLAGLLGVPLQGPYSAAKGAVRLLIDTCRIEFQPYGLRFISLYPGFVATERRAGHDLPSPLEISEDAAAAHIVRALRRGRADHLFPAPMAWLIRLLLILPKPISGRLLRWRIPSPPLPAAGEPHVPGGHVSGE